MRNAEIESVLERYGDQSVGSIIWQQMMSGFGRSTDPDSAVDQFNLCQRWSVDVSTLSAMDRKGLTRNTEQSQNSDKTSMQFIFSSSVTVGNSCHLLASSRDRRNNTREISTHALIIGCEEAMNTTQYDYLVGRVSSDVNVTNLQHLGDEKIFVTAAGKRAMEDLKELEEISQCCM